MSEASIDQIDELMEEIENLQNGKQIAEELLFLVLDYVGEPIILDIEESKKKLSTDKGINVEPDEEAGTWKLEALSVE